jgi:hypothetical protein
MNFFHNYISKPIKNCLDSQKFNHLEYAGQTYTEHLDDSMKYSWISFKSSFYFFIHGIYPDVFQTKGSNTIIDLHSVIKDKIEQIQTKL